MKKTAIIALAAALLSGCIADDRNNFMVDDSFGFTNKDVLSQASIHTGTCTIGLVKNGKGLQEGTLRINRNAADYLPLLDAYNQANKTSYEALMGSLVEMSAEEIHFGVKDIVKNLTLSWDPELVARFIGDSKEYVIPILIESDGLKVNDGRSLQLIRLNRSGLSLVQTIQSRTIERKRIEAQGATLQESLKLDVNLTSAIKGAAVTIPILADETLLEAFNQTQEVAYTLAPEGLIRLSANSVTIPAGALGASFELVLDKSQLLENGKMKDFPPYCLPIRIDKEGIQAVIGQKTAPLQGLQFGNTITYVTVSPAAKGISVVLREWGRYSGESAWYSDLDGFAKGADRTIAMDDEYVYVAHSNATPAIYALSRSNGKQVKKLNLGDAAKNGCTFPVSCVRTVPKADGGSVLTFCSLKETGTQHLFVYAYKDGIDAAPVQILDFLLDKKPAPGVNDFRRYGDRYTVKGTWEDGELWFHTWHADGAARGKTVVFTLAAGKITNPEDPKSYLIDGTANEATAIREVVLYPGWDDVLVTRHNAAATFHNTKDGSDNGWLKWNKTEDLPEFKLSYGYNFFEFHDKRFIAYMQLDAEQGSTGRLIIIEDKGASPSDFPAQLKAQAGRLEFPIQNADSFDTPASVKAESSLGDCTAWEVDGNLYIAALLQGGGLSLFQLQ